MLIFIDIEVAFESGYHWTRLVFNLLTTYRTFGVFRSVTVIRMPISYFRSLGVLVCSTICVLNDSEILNAPFVIGPHIISPSSAPPEFSPVAGGSQSKGLVKNSVTLVVDLLVKEYNANTASCAARAISVRHQVIFTKT